ncbi:conserved hypothetical protein [Burkholderia vietnamiensis]|nr:conserved hypothetical protein [Burkholderia vietnamiensis]SOT46052.1 hypothetical protein F01_570038 [Burkholderia cenocepacia]
MVNRASSEGTLVSPAMPLSFFQRASLAKNIFVINRLPLLSTAPNLLLIFF